MKNILSSMALAGSLSMASASAGALAEDTRICTQPLGYDPSTQAYQTITISCENMESILRDNPDYQALETLRNRKTGEQFTQINDKDKNPIFGVYVPPKQNGAKKKV